MDAKVPQASIYRLPWEDPVMLLSIAERKGPPPPDPDADNHPTHFAVKCMSGAWLRRVLGRLICLPQEKSL